MFFWIFILIIFLLYLRFIKCLPITHTKFDKFSVSVHIISRFASSMLTAADAAIVIAFAVRHKSASSSLAHLRSLYHITFLHSIFFRNFTHIFSFLWIKLHKLISACHFYSPIHFQNIFRNLWFLHIPNILLSHFFDIVIRVKAKDLS